MKFTWLQLWHFRVRIFNNLGVIRRHYLRAVTGGKTQEKGTTQTKTKGKSMVFVETTSERERGVV